MISDKFRKGDRTLSFFMGLLFASTTPIPIIAQPTAIVMAQVSAPENDPNSGDTQPVQALVRQLAVFVGHEDDINSVQFSPDGSLIITTNKDKTARLWDREGNLLAVLRHEGVRGRGVDSATFSSDGSRILTVGRDDIGNTVRLWNKEGDLLAVLRHNSVRGRGVDSATFSSDGSRILTVGKDDKFRDTARLWDREGNLLAVLQHEDERVNSAVFSPDGRNILTANADKTARLWDREGNLLTVIRGHDRWVNSAVFSPDGRNILTASADKTARLWDREGNLLAIFQHEGNWIRVKSAVFSPDGRYILTKSSNNVGRLWDKNGNLLAVLWQEHYFTSAMFSPDSHHILIVGRSNTARLWDMENNTLVVLKHPESINSAVFSPDSRYILTASDKTARLWDREGNTLAVFQHEPFWVYSAIFSPDGRYILTASSDKTARLWDKEGNLLAVIRGHANTVKSAIFSPDGRYILTASDDKTARLWDIPAAIAIQIQQESALQNFEEGVSERNAQLTEVQGSIVRFSPDGRDILTSGNYPTVRLWDIQGNLLTTLEGHDGPVYGISFSPDGRYIFTTTDWKNYLWDREGNLLTVIPKTGGTFSPDGRYVLTFRKGNTARLWDIQGKLLVTLEGHEKQIFSARFSPDSRYILTTSESTVRLWNIQGNLLTTWQGREKFGVGAQFSPDGRYILTTHGDKTARLWNRKGDLLAVLQGHENSLFYPKFSPDGDRIIATNGLTASIWDTQGKLLTVLKGHKYTVSSATFSSDGSHILTISKAAYLWNREGNLLAVFRGHDYGIFDADISPDGRYVVTASLQDNTARVWDVSTAIAAQAEQVTALQNSQENVSENNNQQAAAVFEQAVQLNQQETVESRQLALQKLKDALELYRADKNSAKAAEVLLYIGNIQANLGEFQNALDSYNQALPLSQQAGAIAEQAAILNSLGQLYNDLADLDTALDYHNQTLPLLYQLNDRGGAATTLNNIGDLNAATGKHQDALKSYNQALTLSQSGGDKAAEAASLMGIGGIYTTSKEWSNALNAYNQALIISRFLNDKVKETTILNQLGKVQAASGQESTALDYYNQALSLSRQLGYKTEEANILYNQAILNRQQNNLTAAKTEIETAIKIIEELRTQIASQELRQSYFARNQDYYQFYIDLLMQLHQQNPDQGYDKQAFHISERSRARTLLELLTEANANIREGVAPDLLQQEQTLNAKLDATEKQRIEIYSNPESTPAQKTAIEQQRQQLLADYQQLQDQIRATSPQYAALQYPQPLTLEQVQQQILDEDTILLQYSLGRDNSYLWAVTKDSLTSYQLPPKDEIETFARRFYNLLQIPGYEIGNPRGIAKVVPRDNLNSVAQLSELLFGQVAEQLTKKRIVVVADGALQYIPFAALATPETADTDTPIPLINQYELVNLPSSSTLAIIRDQVNGRQKAPQKLAILADPVFTDNDNRLKTASSRGTELDLNQLLLNRSVRVSDINLNRLPGTRTEAEAILNLVASATQVNAFDFDANRDFIDNPQLRNYQIIHLATHGILNSEAPELSGVVLSLVDQQGNPKNGFLRLHDIFNLNLPAELVVLSACQTGLGEEIRGEGLVGLTRGFMYAGAPRLVVSLWNVDDAATAEFMTRFYQLMLNEGLKPAQALRETQLQMQRETKWKSPYYWAAFTLQGEWN